MNLRFLLANVLYVVRPSVVCLSVTFVHPTQAVEIFFNVFMPFNTLIIWRHPGEIIRRSS